MFSNFKNPPGAICLKMERPILTEVITHLSEKLSANPRVKHHHTDQNTVVYLQALGWATVSRRTDWHSTPTTQPKVVLPGPGSQQCYKYKSIVSKIQKFYVMWLNKNSDITSHLTWKQDFNLMEYLLKYVALFRAEARLSSCLLTNTSWCHAVWNSHTHLRRHANAWSRARLQIVIRCHSYCITRFH